MHIDGVTTQEAGERLAAVSALLRNPPEPCEHIATVTAPVHFAYGPYVGTTDPLTICVTCHAWIHDQADPGPDPLTVDLEERP